MLWKSKHPTLRKLTIIFLSLCISVNLWIQYSSQKMFPILLEYACNQSSKLATLITNIGVEKTLNGNLDKDSIQIFYNDKNTPTSIVFNTKQMNQFLTTLVVYIYQQLKAIEHGDLKKIEEEILTEYDEKLIEKGIIYTIPYGVVFQNPFFAQTGPKFPVKINLVGNIQSNIQSKITTYGINNALIEIQALVSLNIQVIIPIMTSKYQHDYYIPLAMKAIQGDIPTYYQGSNTIDGDSFVIPLT